MLSEARPQTCRTEPTGWELHYAKGVAMIGRSSGDSPMWCHPCNVKSFSWKEPDVFDGGGGCWRGWISLSHQGEVKMSHAINNSPQQGNRYLSLKKRCIILSCTSWWVCFFWEEVGVTMNNARQHVTHMKTISSNKVEKPNGSQRKRSYISNAKAHKTIAGRIILQVPLYQWSLQ